MAYIVLFFFYLGCIVLSECRPGFFKWLLGNTPCYPCPPNSYTNTPKSVECNCADGYYRNPKDSRNSSCTRKYRHGNITGNNLQGLPNHIHQCKCDENVVCPVNFDCCCYFAKCLRLEDSFLICLVYKSYSYVIC